MEECILRKTGKCNINYCVGMADCALLKMYLEEIGFHHEWLKSMRKGSVAAAIISEKLRGLESGGQTRSRSRRQS